MQLVALMGQMVNCSENQVMALSGLVWSCRDENVLYGSEDDHGARAEENCIAGRYISSFFVSVSSTFTRRIRVLVLLFACPI